MSYSKKSSKIKKSTKKRIRKNPSLEDKDHFFEILQSKKPNPFYNVNFSDSDLEGIVVKGKNLTGIILYKSNLRLASFRDCNLSYSIITNANLEHADFTNAYLVGANLTGSYVYKAKFDPWFAKQLRINQYHVVTGMR